jgi:hypothetical protein
MKTVNALACVALLVFAWLTLRHVHDSVFLEDQVDQLQNFEALFRLEPYALLGPAMSGTRPTAHALGPAGVIVFGLPVALGFGIDGGHAVMSLILAGATAFTFVVLLRIDQPFAWLWFTTFCATGLVWWNAGLFWETTLLLPAGLLLMGTAAACLSRPTLPQTGVLILLAVFAMHIHPTAIIAVPIVAIVIARAAIRLGSGQILRLRSDSTPPLSRRATLILVSLTIAAFGPYLLAEGLTGLQNSRAVLAHVRQTANDQPLAIDAARETLLIASDPTQALSSAGLSPVVVVGIGGAMSLGALIALWRRARHTTSPPGGDQYATEALMWLVIISVVVIIGQAVFFALMRRPLGGFHYVTLPAPFYAVIPAAFLRVVLARLLQRRGALIALACASVTFLVWSGPSRADRSMAPAMWSYRNIVNAIDQLCGGGAADTLEGDGFAAVVTPQQDGVLQYLMKRGFVDCRYEPGGQLLIAASRDGHYEDSFVTGGKRYRRDTVRFPGIALYRRVDTEATRP